MVINSRDVTERNRAVQQLRELAAELDGRVQRRTAELEQRNEELHSAKEATEQAMKQQEIFLSNVAHDLRTPLTIVIGFSEDLLRRARKKKIDAFIPDLQLIVNRGKDLLEMINDLLNLSKSMNDKELSLELEEFDVAEMVRLRMEGIGAIAQKYGNTVSFEAAEDLGAMYADKAKVWRVLMNLLTNACKFTKDGSIRVSASRARGGPSGGDRVVFEVSDTGIGMSEDQQKLLFHRFAQVHSGDRLKKAGASLGLSSMGLGLSICMLYCRAMGGRISVRSEEGHGSTFTVELPAVVRKAEDETPPAPTAAPQTHAPRPAGGDDSKTGEAGADLVLIIDDDASVCELISRNLGEEGYRTRAAYDGLEGLRLAKQMLPSAIILDVVMPGIDGWGVLAALKTDAQTADIPIIMVSMLDERERGLKLGADEYVTKPLAGERLPKLLADRLGGRPNARVLVVEDDPDARESLRVALADQGWEVVVCGDGEAALKAMRSARPDLVLLDLVLPGMDGFTVISEIRREPAWHSVPIIVMTAAVLSTEERRGLQEEVEKILYKGLYSRDELFREILAAAGKNPRTKPPVGPEVISA
ncbi:MAG: response regulator [Isosphaeraceae bacterium]